MSLQQATLDHMIAEHGRLMKQENLEEAEDLNEIGLKLWELRKNCAKFIAAICNNVQENNYSEHDEFANAVAHIKGCNDLLDQITVDIEVIDDMMGD